MFNIVLIYNKCLFDLKHFDLTFWYLQYISVHIPLDLYRHIKSAFIWIYQIT